MDVKTAYEQWLHDFAADADTIADLKAIAHAQGVRRVGGNKQHLPLLHMIFLSLYRHLAPPPAAARRLLWPNENAAHSCPGSADAIRGWLRPAGR